MEKQISVIVTFDETEAFVFLQCLDRSLRHCRVVVLVCGEFIGALVYPVRDYLHKLNSMYITQNTWKSNPRLLAGRVDRHGLAQPVLPDQELSTILDLFALLNDLRWNQTIDSRAIGKLKQPYSHVCYHYTIRSIGGKLPKGWLMSTGFEPVTSSCQYWCSTKVS